MTISVIDLNSLYTGPSSLYVLLGDIYNTNSGSSISYTAIILDVNTLTVYEVPFLKTSSDGYVGRYARGFEPDSSQITLYEVETDECLCLGAKIGRKDSDY